MGGLGNRRIRGCSGRCKSETGDGDVERKWRMERAEGRWNWFRDRKQSVIKLNSFSAAAAAGEQRRRGRLLRLLLLPSIRPSTSSVPPLHAGGGLRGAAMAKIRVSYEYSEAEDKSIRLGLFLIACGILSLFILGFCWLSPTLQNLQSKPANCTVSPAASSELPPVSVD